MSLGPDSTHLHLVSINPASPSTILGDFPAATRSDIEKAAGLARGALQAWRDLGVAGRVAMLQKFYDYLLQNKEHFAQLETKEMGRSLKTSPSSITWALEQFAWNLENAEAALAPETTAEDEKTIHQIHFEPWGVFAVIAPWNFPLSNWVMGALQPLIAGNVVLYKASEEVPLCAQEIGNAWIKAGLPPEVMQIIQGAGDVGDLLARADIDFLDFTGSTATGQHLYRVAAERFLPIRLELGGSDAGLVFEDVDLDHVLTPIFWAKFINCGQICCGLKRLFVQETIYPAFLDKFKTYLESKTVGNPEDPATVFGSLVSQRQQKLLAGQIDDAKNKGATILTGGKIPTAEGAFYTPTLLTNVTPDMRAFHEELFGPALPIWSFQTEDEAVQRANATSFGLSAYVFTRDLDRFARLAPRLQAGVVSLNGVDASHPANPFGGYKKSGLGRVGGKTGLRHACQIKTISRPKA